MRGSGETVKRFLLYMTKVWIGFMCSVPKMQKALDILCLSWYYDTTADIVSSDVISDTAAPLSLYKFAVRQFRGEVGV